MNKLKSIFSFFILIFLYSTLGCTAGADGPFSNRYKPSSSPQASPGYTYTERNPPVTAWAKTPSPPPLNSYSNFTTTPEAATSLPTQYRYTLNGEMAPSSIDPYSTYQ